MIGYQPKPKGLGIHDWFKDKIGVTPKTWKVITFLFRVLPSAAKLTKYPLIGPMIKWALMFSPYDKRYTQGITLPLNIDLTGATQKTPVPIDLMKDAIRKSSYILALNRCLCRDSHHCQNYSHEIACIFLGKAARITEKHGLGRIVTAEEACLLVDRAAEQGLVGQALWIEVEQYVWGFEDETMENFLEFCFCCSCCCTAINITRNSTLDIRRRFKSSGWQAEVNDECILCEKCAPICPQHAITYDKQRALVSTECFGCGLCNSVCPTDAINLVMREPLKEKVEDYFTGLKLDL
ncbi:4Fe-4S binding protein [Sodalis sp. dw_96]|uniref:DUF362 domain-containing protein n=1 Tax=Sodalis sp. dw_96 TaxID=2719794 RepID=UPI001BD29D54|nr:4Fe-4S binding protein [Sodalis sp. dw_96]